MASRNSPKLEEGEVQEGSPISQDGDARRPAKSAPPSVPSDPPAAEPPRKKRSIWEAPTPPPTLSANEVDLSPGGAPAAGTPAAGQENTPAHEDSARTPDVERAKKDDEEEEVEKREYHATPPESVDRPQSSPSPAPAGARAIVNALRDRGFGCRSVDCYEKMNRIDEGTYGVVFRARDKETGEVVALKKVKMEREREGFPVTSLREINILLSIHHKNIVNVKEICVGHNLDAIFMVMEFMEHDLKSLMEGMKQPFTTAEVKCLLLQLLEGIAALHDNWILHRDLKTSNLLMDNAGHLKICDFGLARQYGSPLKPYTHMVVTLWYRAPELLLGAKSYSTAIDMWSAGCIFAEMLQREPLVMGKGEIDQIDKIFRLLGTPTKEIWKGVDELPNFKKVRWVQQPYNNLRQKFPPASFIPGKPHLSEAGFDLLNRMLTYDPVKRISAAEALRHPWFQESPPAKDPELMPTFPSLHEDPTRKRRRGEDEDLLHELEVRRGAVKEEEETDYSAFDRSYAAKGGPPPAGFKLKAAP
eukprot:tig00001003_g6280.t1